MEHTPVLDAEQRYQDGENEEIDECPEVYLRPLPSRRLLVWCDYRQHQE